MMKYHKKNQNLKNNEISLEEPIFLVKKIKINNTYKAYHGSYVLNTVCSLDKVS